MTNESPGTRPAVHLLVPLLSWMWTEAVLALWRLREKLPPGSQFTYVTGLSSIPAARNTLAASALRGPHEYFLWVDGDMVPRPDSADQLLRVAQRTGADLVSALYFTRVLPQFQLACRPMPATEADSTGVQEAESVGFGCALMHRRLLERLPWPWFEHAPDAKQGVVDHVGEDLQLCRKARAAGMRIVVDWSHEVGHLAVLPVTGGLVVANLDGLYPGDGSSLIPPASSSAQ